MQNKKKIILFIGGPGSGKSTQGEILSKKFSIPHLSTGNILRNMMDNKKKYQKNILDSVNHSLNGGNLLQDDLVNQVMSDACMDKNCKYGFILDGYPRTVKQAMYFLEKYSGSDIFIFVFDVLYDVVKKRILGRYYCSTCNQMYNTVYNNPSVKGTCDRCGFKKFFKRKDDVELVVHKRFQDHVKNAEALINYCKNNTRCYVIDANQEKEVLSKSMCDLMD